MSLQVVTLTCPSCGATLTIDDGRDSCFCSYCGSKVQVVNENEYIYRHIDEAGIKQAEVDRDIRMRQLDIEERDKGFDHQVRKILFYLWLASIAVVALLCLYLAFFTGELGGLSAFNTLFYVGGPVVGGGAYILFKLLPDRDEDKIVRANGGIRFPKGHEPFNEQHYETVLSSLRAAGFYNVTAINMHDLKIGLFQKPGKIEKITVAGKDITSGGRYYDPNVPIVITYHGV